LYHTDRQPMMTGVTFYFWSLLFFTILCSWTVLLVTSFLLLYLAATLLIWGDVRCSPYWQAKLWNIVQKLNDDITHHAMAMPRHTHTHTPHHATSHQSLCPGLNLFISNQTCPVFLLYYSLCCVVSEKEYVGECLHIYTSINNVTTHTTSHTTYLDWRYLDWAGDYIACKGFFYSIDKV